MKKKQKTSKQLTQRDYDRMWGEDGPYSQVRLCEETRILDDSVSRVFLVVEATINPFTFEYIKEHRQLFIDDAPVLQLLDHAEYRDKFGYVVSAGEVEFQDEDSKRFVKKQAEMTIQTLIRMHTFVMNEFGIARDTKFAAMEDSGSSDERFVWNDKTGRIELADGDLWDNKTMIGSPAGIKNNKIRFFIIFAFTKDFDFKKESVVIIAKTLKKVSLDFKVDIEDVESFKEYFFITTFIPFDVAPDSFIQVLLDECNKAWKKQIFKQDYFITNVKRPTQEQIIDFLNNV